MNEFYTARKAALEAGEIIRKYFGKVGYKLKGRANPVTKADTESEKKIRGIIVQKFKNDTIIFEENGLKVKDKKRVWLIDPLDGTVNYAHSFPHFAVSIGFAEEGVVKMGLIYDCIKNEMFYALKGKGAYLNDKRINVSKTKNLSSALLATGFAYDRGEKAEFYCSFYSSFLKKSHDIRRCGAASLDMAYTACGRIDGYWEFNLKPWDVGAGKIIVEEAGGKVSDFSGKEWALDFRDLKIWGKEVLCTNSKIHYEMLGVIKPKLNRL